jgi:hypothetical protein
VIASYRFYMPKQPNGTPGKKPASAVGQGQAYGFPRIDGDPQPEASASPFGLVG